MIVTVEVDVALMRPPRVDRTSRVLVDTPTPSWVDGMASAEADAVWVAIAMCCGRPGVVMPVGSRVVAVSDL